MADEQNNQEQNQEPVQNVERREVLKDVISKAIDSVELGDEKKEGSQKIEEGVETDTDKKDETKESELNETEQIQAQQLFKALKDPEQAPQIIEFIAKQAGYGKIETPKEAQEAKDAVLEALQESLGPDFEFLTPKLSKAINKILETKLTEHTRDIREDIAQEREAKIRTETTSAYTTISQKYFGKDEMPQNIMSEMSKLMEYYKPAAGMNVSEYLNDMLQTAAARLDIDIKKVKQTNQNNERISKNRNDAVGRLASERGAVTESKVIGTPQNRKLSLNEAIEKAEAEIAEKIEK